jgi:hypothetical protein
MIKTIIFQNQIRNGRQSQKKQRPKKINWNIEKILLFVLIAIDNHELLGQDYVKWYTFQVFKFS